MAKEHRASRPIQTIFYNRGGFVLRRTRSAYVATAVAAAARRISLDEFHSAEVLWFRNEQLIVVINSTGEITSDVRRIHAAIEKKGNRMLKGERKHFVKETKDGGKKANG